MTDLVGQRSSCASRFRWNNKHVEETERIVVHPRQDAAVHRKYCRNETTTTKYNVLTFLPKSLFEQYR